MKTIKFLLIAFVMLAITSTISSCSTQKQSLGYRPSPRKVSVSRAIEKKDHYPFYRAQKNNVKSGLWAN